MDASYVSVPFMEQSVEKNSEVLGSNFYFIASNAPMEHNKLAFWKMIMQNNVKKVVNLREANTEIYIPDSGEVKLGGFKLKCQPELTETNQHLVIKQVQIF